MRCTLLPGLVVAAALAPSYLSAQEVRGPLPPEQSLRHFRLDAGLKLELVAADPQVSSPVAMAFDEDGRLWVVEMRDYPNGPAPGKPPEGRVKVLEDKDGDGFYEKATVFADDLLFANGLLPWRGGALVTAAPHVALLRDTDGDGKADKREVLYEGFATQNPQLRVSHPALGLDNWVYVANGLRGGQVKRAGDPNAQPVNLSGMDFRFDLLTGRHEAVSGMGQYGNTFDDWGNRFVCDNNHHLRHIVLPSQVAQRNPYLAVPAVLEDTTTHERGPLSSGIRIYPLSRNWTTSSLHVGRFTAACGVFIYRGDLLPEQYRGGGFTCDPTGNLVHLEILTPHGATFRSRPHRDGVEFLATPEEWFRPVSMAHGPDGALYIVDMYRAVIEHPEFMPAELKNRPDLTLGKEKGRIWRVVPDRPRAKTPRPQLSKASSAELVQLLEHPNAWQRTTAQRLLLERQDQAAVEPLRRLVQSQGNPLGRAHAAWLLAAYGRLGEAELSRLLADEDPRVREQGVWLAAASPDRGKAVAKLFNGLATHPDARVRFAAALAEGNWEEPSLDALAAVAGRDADDRWARLAVASAVPRQAGKLLPKMITSEPPAPGRLTLVQELAGVVGARRDQEETVATLQLTLDTGKGKDPRWQVALLTGLADGMARRGTQLGAFLQQLPAEKKELAEGIGARLQRSGDLAADPGRSVEERTTALRLLAHAPWASAKPILARLLTEDPAQEIRLAAVRALAAQPHAEAAAVLLQGWRSYTPAVRREVGEAMTRQPERILALLAEVEAGRIRPNDLDPARARQLVNHNRPDIRERSRKLLQASLPADRKQVLDQYREALTLKSDPQRGKAVFQKHCATCHRVAGLGTDVGADIADTRTKTLEQLYNDILNPNAAIDSNYINYVVTTRAGKVATGVIAVETAGSLTLKRAEGQTEEILKQDIEEIQSTGVSLMPEGLEKQLTAQDLADLLNFLKNWRYLDGATPLGTAPARGP